MWKISFYMLLLWESRKDISWLRKIWGGKSRLQKVAGTIWYRIWIHESYYIHESIHEFIFYTILYLLLGGGCVGVCVCVWQERYTLKDYNDTLSGLIGSDIHLVMRAHTHTHSVFSTINVPYLPIYVSFLYRLKQRKHWGLK